MEERTVPHIRIPIQRDSVRTLVPCLVVLEGGPVGEIFRIKSSSVVIGRSVQSDVCLSVEGVSRQHARIDVQETIYTISDLDSTNGTLLNGNSVQQASIKNGDEIMIGEVLLRFSLQDEADLATQELNRKQAVKDQATGVANRDYFLETLNREWNYAIRHRHSLSLAIFGVDGFETVEHQYGMAIGNQVLKAVSDRIAEGLRAYDLIGRISTCEFAVLLRDTAIENATIFAQRTQNRVAQLAFDVERHTFQVSVSVGLASSNMNQISEVETIMIEAQNHLKKAMHTGRNKFSSSRLG